MIPAPHDQGDPLGDAHASDLTGMGEVKDDLQLWRRSKRDYLSTAQRPVTDPALPGQQAAVADKGHQSLLSQVLPENGLILAAPDMLPHDPLGCLDPGQGLLHNPGHILEQYGLRPSAQDCSPPGREAHRTPGFNPVLRENHGRPEQDLLAAAVDGHLFALGPLTLLRADLPGAASDLSGQEILGCCPAHRIGQKVGREPGPLCRHKDTQLAGWGKRVALDMIDMQRPVPKIVLSLQILVGLVAFAVDPVQFLVQVLFAEHHPLHCIRHLRIRTMAAPGHLLSGCQWPSTSPVVNRLDSG